MRIFNQGCSSPIQKLSLIFNLFQNLWRHWYHKKIHIFLINHNKFHSGKLFIKMCLVVVTRSLLAQFVRFWTVNHFNCAPLSSEETGVHPYFCSDRAPNYVGAKKLLFFFLISVPPPENSWICP